MGTLNDGYSRLPATNDHDSVDVSSTKYAFLQTLMSCYRSVLAASSFVILLYIAIIITIRDRGSTYCDCRHQHNSEHFTLADSIIQYEDRPEWGQISFPWNLEPSDELDEMWTNFLSTLNIRVSEDELNMLGEPRENRVRVSGGGYAGVMGVTHHMHCLNNLRRVIHWDYYESRLSNLTAYEKEAFSKEHSDHCLDVIRQSLMCKANTNMYMLEWPQLEEGQHRPERPAQTVTSYSKSTCVNWDVLDNWARQRALQEGQFQYLWVPSGSLGSKMV